MEDSPPVTLEMVKDGAEGATSRKSRLATSQACNSPLEPLVARRALPVWRGSLAAPVSGVDPARLWIIIKGYEFSAQETLAEVHWVGTVELIHIS